jgi:hypothetical protein
VRAEPSPLTGDDDGDTITQDDTSRSLEPGFVTSILEGVSEKQQPVKERQMWFGTAIGLIIWIVIAFWPARVARRKGHSFVGYFVLSLIFFPLALILAYVVRDRRDVALI